MQAIVEDQKQELSRLCQKYDVELMYLFGSATSIDDFKETSDIDILISFKPDISVEKYTDNYFDLHNELESLFGRKVDLITENSLSNPYFIKSITETRKLLYAA
ncbi:nucleotidyltransferase domain-containing protein [Salibacter sp.]|uniref:nucleotidyltransferase family protein n=1 Tax=Salibacter sp. TaxID=2010995 RepID=UPI0028704CC4|nr:nucleotidyltransferase domain-containing protein [Salibacter sp.]MDR9486835.1 nucleotidyltransferase domain-containing protein [Salibacter sp.]